MQNTHMHNEPSALKSCVCVSSDLCLVSHRGYPAGQVCHSCAAGCASCVKNATHCLSCDEPLLLHKHQCVEECPPTHTVRDGECQHCPSACQECNPLGQCTGTEANFSGRTSFNLFCHGFFFTSLWSSSDCVIIIHKCGVYF